tara:strand:+ start:538 stop:924 length:387 start_codon:yes stop_codon:yes gene_type:complete
MSLTHVTAVRNALADEVVDRIDVGTADTEGDIEIQDSGNSTLCVIDLANPAFGAASSGVATAQSLPVEGTCTGAGDADHFLVRDRDNAEIFRGTVTATGGGGDMQLSSVTLAVDDVVRLNTFTYTASA